MRIKVEKLFLTLIYQLLHDVYVMTVKGRVLRIRMTWVRALAWVILVRRNKKVSVASVTTGRMGESCNFFAKNVRVLVITLRNKVAREQG